MPAPEAHAAPEAPAAPAGRAARALRQPMPMRVRGKATAIALAMACAVAATLLPVAPARAAEPLTVCMAEDNPPLSYRQPGAAAVRGLDLRIAQAAADALGRPLVVRAFDTDYEKESSLTHEVNALLSAGLCEAVSGFPLLRADLGPPSRPTARTAGYPGAPRRRDRPWITLGTLVPSKAYLGAALGLVLPQPVPGLESLLDLAQSGDGGARKLGASSGTLASALTLGWRHGVLRLRTVSLGQRDDPFEALQKGQVGALLMPLARFDGWKLLHPGSPVVATAWRRPIGVNLGFVTLSGAAAVREAFDRVIAEALADGRLARWAAEEGVSWTAPRPPDVSAGPSMLELTAD